MVLPLITDSYKQVYYAERVTPEIELDQLTRHLRNTDLAPPIPPCRTRRDWIREQRRHRCAEIWGRDPRMLEAQDALVLYAEKPGDPPRTIVPDSLQKPLIQWEHHHMCHMSAGKLYYHLKKKFFFPNMHKMCTEVVND